MAVGSVGFSGGDGVWGHTFERISQHSERNNHSDLPENGPKLQGIVLSSFFGTR